MTQEMKRLLLTELRMAVYQPGDPGLITDEKLCESVTVNENLGALGFALRPADMVSLAASGTLYTLYEDLKPLVPEVTAQPMYPGFPEEVMNMTEAVFRMHQAFHYASTYGIECLTGIPVSRGWLPESDAPVRTEEDIRLLDRKVIELVPEEEAPLTAVRILMSRRERLTNPELELMRECIPACEAAEIAGLTIRFKENLEPLFFLWMEIPDRKAALAVLRRICVHSGDVLRCAKSYLGRKKYHLSTGEKKLLVRLLESYPVRNFRENLMSSRQGRERNLIILQHLDYNRFSGSESHREIVRALRGDELQSWQAAGEALLKEKCPEALEHYARRPGYMIRMLNRLLSLGYTREEICAALTPRAGEISGHLAISTLSVLARRRNGIAVRHAEEISRCLARYEAEARQPCLCDVSMTREMAWKELQARKQWLDQPEEELRSRIFAPVNGMKAEAREKEKELTRNRVYEQSLRSQVLANRHPLFVRNAGETFDRTAFEEARSGDPLAWIRNRIRQQETELAEFREKISQSMSDTHRHYREELERLREEGRRRYEAELEEIRRWGETESARQEKENARLIRQYQENLKTLPERKAAELEELEKKHQTELNSSRFDAGSAEILREVLQAHFRQASTPLKGKKVFLDMDSFDLEHSELETRNRSRDGGYIRSGICWRIPEEARYVRFFVYWNDSRRVDIDLHAGGRKTDGTPLHIGWNADFRNSGAVFSGDITHSDAAEYIDIDLSAPIREIWANIHLFSGRRTLREVETCYVGLMAVSRTNQQVKHYDPKNCFFIHPMTQNLGSLFYGYVDVQNRYVRFVGQPNEGCWEANPGCAGPDEGRFSLRDYLDCVLGGQECRIVSEREEAEIVLTMAKNDLENGLSLVDHNFFLEC